MRRALAFLAEIELFLADTDALLFHNSGAKGRQAVDAARDDVLHILHAAGPDENHQIHNEAGVDAGAQNGHAVGLGDLIQRFRQIRMLGLGISHLLCGGDDVDSLLQNKLHTREGDVGEGIGTQQNHVGSAGPDDILGRTDDDVRTLAAFGLDVVKHAGTDFLAAAGNADDIHALFLQQHIGHAAAHGSQTPDDYLNVFHSSLHKY